MLAFLLGLDSSAKSFAEDSNLLHFVDVEPRGEECSKQMKTSWRISSERFEI
jgi:hypothetical protein